MWWMKYFQSSHNTSLSVVFHPNDWRMLNLSFHKVLNIFKYEIFASFYSPFSNFLEILHTTKPYQKPLKKKEKKFLNELMKSKIDGRNYYPCETTLFTAQQICQLFLKLLDFSNMRKHFYFTLLSWSFEKAFSRAIIIITMECC